jgi:hypothetical protein
VRELLSLAALLLAGCEVYSGPKPAGCPGTKVATFNFTACIADGGVLSDGGPVCDGGGSTCPFGPPAGGAVLNPASFTASLYWDPGGSAAALCIDQPHAEPHLGTHDGDAFDASYQDVGALVTVDGGSCAVNVLETISGEVVRSDGGAVTGLAHGELRNDVSPADGGLPDGGVTDCGLPCTIRYQLDGAP